MHPLLRNILGPIFGVFIGGIVNMKLIELGIKIAPLPEGADLQNFGEFMDQFSAMNFVTPFLAHAIGTLVGAFTAAKIAATHKMRFGIGIGCFFLLGGITMVAMLPNSPIWFSALDLVLAYIPMGWFGAKLAGTSKVVNS